MSKKTTIYHTNGTVTEKIDTGKKIYTTTRKPGIITKGKVISTSVTTKQ